MRPTLVSTHKVSMTNDELREAKRKLRECRRRLKESQAINERLYRFIGSEELQGWKPQEQVEREYGWIYAWLYPLREYLDQHIGQILTHDIQWQVIDIITAIIAQTVVMGKYGVKLPLDPVEQMLRVSWQNRRGFSRKNMNPVLFVARHVSHMNVTLFPVLRRAISSG